MAKDKDKDPLTPLPDTLKLTRRIRLVADHLRAVGPYQYGVDYEVPAEVAARLVPARGFIYVDEPLPAPATPAEEPN